MLPLEVGVSPGVYLWGGNEGAVGGTLFDAPPLFKKVGGGANFSKGNSTTKKKNRLRRALIG